MALRTMCGRCGSYLSVPPGARSVRCPLCHAVTRVERRPHGLHYAAVGFIKGLISSIVSPGAQQQQPQSSTSLSSASLRPGAAASQLPPSYPRVRGCKKRALLVGISYAGTKYELKGSVNDVNCMGFMLRERFNFPSECILVMTQEDKDPDKVPTKYNLRQAMRWLVEGTSSGDSLVFHFSGHGVQKLDTNGDEVDGYDEALCPMDFKDCGVILDDEVNATIVRPLGPGVTLHAIIDTCHSGTILDLPYLCRISRILAMGEPQPPVRRAQVHQRRPRHLDQRLRRQPNVRRHHGVLRLHLDRRHDVQLHQGGGVRPGHHLRPPPHGDEGDHPRQWRRVWHPRAHRYFLPPCNHLQLRAGAPAVRFGTV